MVSAQWHIWWVLSSCPPPAVPQLQPESGPEEHYLEQQARLHHPISHLLLHWHVLLPDNHWRRHTQVACVLCAQTGSASYKFTLDTKTNQCSILLSTLPSYQISYISIFPVTVSNIMEVYLNSSGPVEALKGERMVLNCTATGELNTRVNITWDYPGKVRLTLKSVETLYEAELHSSVLGWDASSVQVFLLSSFCVILLTNQPTLLVSSFEVQRIWSQKQWSPSTVPLYDPQYGFRGF